MVGHGAVIALCSCVARAVATSAECCALHAVNYRVRPSMSCNCRKLLPNTSRSRSSIHRLALNTCRRRRRRGRALTRTGYFKLHLVRYSSGLRLLHVAWRSHNGNPRNAKISIGGYLCESLRKRVAKRINCNSVTQSSGIMDLYMDMS